MSVATLARRSRTARCVPRRRLGGDGSRVRCCGSSSVRRAGHATRSKQGRRRAHPRQRNKVAAVCAPRERVERHEEGFHLGKRDGATDHWNRRRCVQNPAGGERRCFQSGSSARTSVLTGSVAASPGAPCSADTLYWTPRSQTGAPVGKLVDDCFGRKHNISPGPQIVTQNAFLTCSHHLVEVVLNPSESGQGLRKQN